MKDNAIIQVINSHFKTVQKLIPITLSGFDNHDIFLLRREIKMLKAFLHLVDMEKNTRFSISKVLKSFYGYVGIIQNLQLQLAAVEPYTRKDASGLSLNYIDQVRKEIIVWEKNAAALTGIHESLHVEEPDNVKLPERLSKAARKKFMNYISFELQFHIGRLKDDESFHTVRKLLEDVLFNVPYLDGYMDLLPEGLNELHEITSLVEPLSHFREKCIAVTLIQTWYNDATGFDGNMIRIIDHLKSEKKELRDSLYARMESIPLKPLVKRMFDLHS
jgi:hypothetical protein